MAKARQAAAAPPPRAQQQAAAAHQRQQQLCLYYYHGSRGESLAELNAFTGAVRTLRDFAARLPVREPGLHFRFRAEDPKYGYVWVDIMDPAAVLPVYQGHICAQVLRLGRVHKAPQASRLQRKTVNRKAVAQYRMALKNATVKKAQRPAPSRTRPAAAGAPPRKAAPGAKKARPRPAPSSAAPHPAAASAAAPAAAPAAATPAPAPAEPPKPRMPGIIVDDIDDDDDPPVASAGAAGGAGSSSAATAPVNAAGLGGDLNFMAAPAAAPAANGDAGAAEGDTEEAYRAKHGPRIREWAVTNGKPRSLMALLSTMDQVLYEGARWKGYSLGDLLEPKKVRIAYLKAQQVVHSDKIQKLNLSLEKETIASLICSSLNEAYEVFKNENGL